MHFSSPSLQSKSSRVAEKPVLQGVEQGGEGIASLEASDPFKVSHLILELAS